MKSAQTRQASVPTEGPYLLALVKDGPPIPARFVIKGDGKTPRNRPPDDIRWTVELDGKEQPDSFTGAELKEFQADNIIKGSVWSNDFEPATALLHMRLMMFGRIITEDQYERLMWKRDWWRQALPNHPALDAYKPIKLSRVRGLGRMVRPFEELDEETPGIGDNSRGLSELDPELEAADELKLAADTTHIQKVLEYKYSDLMAFVEDDIDDIERWMKRHMPPDAKAGTKPVIVDIDDCAMARDLVGHVTEFLTGEMQPAQKAVKASVLEAGKTIDGFFYKKMRDVLLPALEPIRFAMAAWMKADVEAKKNILNTQHAQARAVADRLLDEAVRSEENKDTAFDAAMEAEAAADRAAEAANASVLELSRSRTDLDRPFHLTESYTWEVQKNEDGKEVGLIELVMAVARGEEDVSLLCANTKVIDALVKPKNGRRKIVGLHIHPEYKV